MLDPIRGLQRAPSPASRCAPWSACLVVALLALVAASGCAPGDSAGREGFVSGSRLRARIDDGGGGARAFRGWYDSRLNIDCRFARAEDGTWRCLPTGLALSPAWLDAGCTQRVLVRLASACDATTFATTYAAPAACGGESLARVYRAGPERAGVTAVFQGSAGNCAEVALPAGARVHDAVDEPLSSFVAATERMEARTERVAVQVVLGEDGSREAIRMRDRELAIECVPAAFGSEVRCAPLAAAFVASSTFADASCAERVATEPFGAVCASRAFAVEPGSSCGSTPPRWYAVGEPIAGSEAHTQQPDGTCQPSAGSSTGRYRRLGAALEYSSLAPLRDEVAGSGRLHVRRAATSDGQALAATPASALVDAQTGNACSLYELRDGSMRCVPAGAGALAVVGALSGSEYFLDAACTARAVPTYGSGGCTPPTPAFALRAESNPVACTGSFRVRVYEVGPERTGQPLWTRDSAGGCTETTLAGARVFELGAEQSPDAFARVERRTE